MLEINNTTRRKIDRKKAEEITVAFLRAYRRPKAIVSLAIVGDARMATINGRYRGAKKPTDVLSFPGEAPYLGEIIIDIQETRRVKRYGSLFQELELGKPQPGYLFCFLLVHGLLHLVGYNDQTDKGRREMLARGKKFLARFFR